MLPGPYLEQTGSRIRRWLGAIVAAIALHGAVGAGAMWWLQHEATERQRPGAILIDLNELAAESPSDQTVQPQEPQFQTAAPPPQPTDDLEQTPPPEAPVAKEMPPEPEQKVAKEAEVPPPEMSEPDVKPLAETAPPSQEIEQTKAEPQPEDIPKIEEAPLAPKPEVVLPQVRPIEPVEQAAEKQPESTEKKEPVAEPPKTAPREPATESQSDRQRAQKSDSRARREAAASAKGVFDPNPVYRASPAYPPAARSNKVEGVVVVSYSVSASGTVTNVRVVSATPSGVFDAVTIAAVSQWRFKPPGQPVHGRRTTVRFKLR